MKLETFYYLLVVAENKSITKAAALLHVSQPHLSKIISKVENELGVTLFNRHTQSFEPTIAGLRYLEYCRKFVNLEQEFKNAFNSPRSKQLTIGVPRVRGSYFLPIILPLFKVELPNVFVEICEMKSDIIGQKVADGTIDIGVFGHYEIRGDVINEKLFDEKMLLMIPQKHYLYYKPIDNRSIPILSEDMFQHLEGDTFIAVDSRLSITRRVISFLEQFGVHCSISIAAQNDVTTYRLCEMGMGDAVIMEAAMRNTTFYNQPCFWQICSPPLAIPWYIAYRKGEQLTDAQKLFLNLVKEHIKKILLPRSDVL